MTYRNGNYAAFYVAGPFHESNLGAYATPDFCHYQTLRMWKGGDSSFPFNDSHMKNYNVRDGSSWELTLKPRLRERLRNSKNIVLFLSTYTKASKALNEEMEYGIVDQGLPVIVVYPGLNTVVSRGSISGQAVALWDRLPAFRRNMGSIPTLHIPMEKDAIRRSLSDSDFMVQTKVHAGLYVLK